MTTGRFIEPTSLYTDYSSIHHCTPPHPPAQPHLRWQCTCGIVWTSETRCGLVNDRIFIPGVYIWRRESWWQGRRRRKRDAASGARGK